jgi:hypothetical protein
MELIIKEKQKYVDNYLLNNETKKYSQILDHISPIIEKLKSKDDYIQHTKINSGIDVYCEAIFNKMFEIYQNKMKIIDFIPCHAILACLIKHMYVINFIIAYLSTTERKTLMCELSETLTNVYGDYDSNEQMSNLIKLFSIEEIDNLTIFSKFNYFMGFDFTEELYCKTYNEIFKHLNISDNSDIHLFIIHCSYNLDNLNSIVLYNDIPKNKKILLDDRTIQQFSPWTFSKKIIANTKPYDFFNLKFEPIDFKLEHKYLMCLCYDNAENYNDMRLTAVTMNNDTFISGSIIEKMLKGEIFRYITKDIINKYQELMLYELTTIRENTIDKFINDVNNIVKIISDLFENSNQSNIANKIKENKELDKYFPYEREYFDIYINDIITIPKYSLKTVIKYVKDYFNLDLDANLRIWKTD